MSSALLERASAQQTKLALVDCDVHHALRSPKDLYPYLPAKWREHLATYGSRRPVPFTGQSPYFKSAPALSRKDAWPPNGGSPGSDLKFLQEQLLHAVQRQVSAARCWGWARNKECYHAL